VGSTKALPGSVDLAVLRGMALIAIPIIAAGSLGSMAFLSQYGLTRADHERNAAELARRRTLEDRIAAAPAGPASIAPVAGTAP